jgi:antitoxin component YwqK of YwqJK toxin-antitoxin module
MISFSQNRDSYVEKRYDNGRLKYTANFVKGKPVGLFKKYYPCGMLNVKMNYSDDSRHASAEIYDRKGQMIAIGNYIDKKKDGVWKYYNNKILSSSESYDKGLRNGKSYIYYKSGKVSLLSEYNKGKRDGVYRRFFKNGKVYFECMYKQNNLNGYYRSYNSIGYIEISGFYKNNQKHGDWLFYTKDGKIKKQVKYLFGVPDKKTELDSLENIRTKILLTKSDSNLFNPEAERQKHNKNDSPY